MTASTPTALPTAGLYSISSSSSNLASEFIYRPQILITANTSYSRTLTTSSSEKLKVLSVQEIINSLKEDGLPLTVIAEITRVGRKTVYSWLAGGAIRLENQQRLETLYELLFTNKRASLLHLYRYWNHKIDKRLSLAALLKKKKLDIVAIRKILVELWTKANTSQTNLRQSYLEANEDEGQREAIEDWSSTLADGSDEW